MANFFNITLDTTSPSNPLVTIEGGATYTTHQLVSVAIATGDSSTSNYQMKLWGDVDVSWGKTNGVLNSTATTANETDAQWISFSSTKQLQLTNVDGAKTIYLKIRDDVYNESAQASSNIILNTAIPSVTVGTPDVTRISKQSGKNVVNFSFQSDVAFTSYKVCFVSSSSAVESSGIVIGTTNGSVNMNNTGNFTASTPINCSINGADLQAANAGDGSKIIKVFVKNAAGTWSV